MNQTHSLSKNAEMKHLVGPNLVDLGIEVGKQQAIAKAAGKPIFYTRNGELVEERPDGTVLKSSGPPPIACAVKLPVNKSTKSK